MSRPSDSEEALVQKAWTDAFAQCSTARAREASASDSKKLGLATLGLVYGETSLRLLLAARRRIVFSDGYGREGKREFVDLGSGSGRVVIAAALLWPRFACVRGVECLATLHAEATAVQKRFIETVAPNLRPRRVPRVDFACGDFTKRSAGAWWGADVVYATCTCFDEGMMSKIERLARRMRKGSYFLSLSKPLPASKECRWKVLGCDRGKTSWGGADLFTQVKCERPSALDNEAEPWEASDSSSESEEEDNDEEDASVLGWVDDS